MYYIGTGGAHDGGIAINGQILTHIQALLYTQIVWRRVVLILAYVLITVLRAQVGGRYNVGGAVVGGGVVYGHAG